uniref:LytR/AlgR family response regulator transcription factor n=1 Tax=Streptomyces corallincola TaxID=2851888 RepID=UPI001FE6FF88|nr:LytTR family DNA-binding domain-containing protein [Streptomyces corallincola]
MLRALAVDDEEPALAELVYLLGEDPRIASVVAAGGTTEALAVLAADAAAASGGPSDGGGDGIDVVFLDIDMPGLGGLGVAELLGGLPAPPLIVFVTAHEDFALRAFDLKAVDYLLKPLRRERFAEAVRRVAELTRAGQGPRPAPAAEDPAHALADQVPVELAGVTRFVAIPDITWVEAQGDYARLHTAHGSHLLRVPLSGLEEQWRAHGFVRIHRSRLVALGHIEELRLEGGNLTVRIGERTLAVSRRNARELRDLLARHAQGAVGRPHR